ncbi:hypothetical protein Vretifemale_20674 [Volvox reticuliferus]|uniref:Uncharacterized protein n=1 Tax=Volvox reticuliferus TaxID=1737510 RepID=A0A8J4D1C6_9CHLO|nr:hypothetical protein Vretifemale_20674 [Volvox reticuliferus]
MGVTYHVNPFSCIEELAAACPGVLVPVRCGSLLPPHHTPVSLVRPDSVVIFRCISLRQPGRAAWTWLPQCPAPGGDGNEHLTVRDVAILLDTRRFLREYPDIAGYVRDLYSVPGISRAVNMDHIKTHYFTSHPRLNCHAVIPRGGAAWWTEPSSRAERFGGGEAYEAAVGVAEPTIKS